MKATSVEELQVFQRAEQLCDLVEPLLERPGFRRDTRLRDQIRDALDSIVSNIAEGFEQPTDRAFAKFLFIAKGSNAEVRRRLRSGLRRRHIEQDQLAQADALADEVARMLTGLIKYLAKSDRKDRGLGL